MGVIRRVRDIVGSNVSAVLDKAENPEKLVRLMIREMEDALVGIKAHCARAIAEGKRLGRQLDDAQKRVDEWTRRAKLAVENERDDLAREALAAKRNWSERVEALKEQQVQLEDVVTQYKCDMATLEEKLAAAREKQRTLVQRHAHAFQSNRAGHAIRRFDTSNTLLRAERFHQRIDSMTERDEGLAARPVSLETAFGKLETDADIEAELASLKQALAH